MKLAREDLVRMYWGPDCLPSQWKEPFQIAEELNEELEFVTGEEFTEGYIRDALIENGIETREVLHFAHLEVWKLLTGGIGDDSWNLECGKQFLYRTTVNGTLVDFYFPEQHITITLDKFMDPSEVRASHVSVISMFRLSPIHISGVREVVKKLLIRGKIGKCYEGKKEEENAW